MSKALAKVRAEITIFLFITFQIIDELPIKLGEKEIFVFSLQRRTIFSFSL